jgi:AcrR family transcriptional regulator
MSRATVKTAKSKPRGRRGIDRNAILEAAFELIDCDGESGFSVRKVGARFGVDPMTVLHHFGTKDQLLRVIADRALMSVEIPPPTGSWRQDMRNVADAYRDLAHRHPRIFHLHFRYNATGPLDHASSEVVYQALRTLGLTDDLVASLGLAFYAFVMGFALAETEGQMAPLNPLEEAELSELPERDYPVTRALIPSFRALDPDLAFDAAVNAFMDGLALRVRN